MIKYLRSKPRWLEKIYVVTHWMLRPLRPWLKPGGWVEGAFVRAEQFSKKGLFDCQMCGQCVLHSTGMICPKNLRNGPCGGVRVDGCCEIEPSMLCVWVSAWERSKEMPRYGSQILTIQPPLNQQLQGTSAWINDLTSGSVGAGWGR